MADESGSIQISAGQPPLGPHGLTVRDHIDDVSYHVSTGTDVTPVSIARTRFAVPVDTGVRITTDTVTLPAATSVTVRYPDGRYHDTVQSTDTPLSQSGPLCFEPQSLPLELFIAVPDAVDVTVNTTADQTRISVDTPTDILLGARSYHTHPPCTVTVPPTPAGAMTALSVLSTSLKTLSPERTDPALRGHPPLVEPGRPANIPAAVDPPDTPIQIEIPQEFRYLYATAPLAYFLGATVVAGDTPLLRVNNARYPLAETGPIDETLNRLLKQLFMMEAAARTHGRYDVATKFQTALDDRLAETPHNLQWSDLYHQDITERLQTYLDIPDHYVADLLPSWSVTTSISPRAERIPALSVLARDLSMVDLTLKDARTSLTPSLDELTTTDGNTSPTDSDTGPTLPDATVQFPPPTAAATRNWLAPGYPLGASKPHTPPDVYDKTPATDDQQTEFNSTLVVADHETPAPDQVIDDIQTDHPQFTDYGSDVVTSPTVDDLADILYGDDDLVHYIGKVTDSGFRCSDGHLNPHQLDRTSAVGTLVANGYRSRGNIRALLDAGVAAAAVSLIAIQTAAAVEYGQTLARTLSCGFPVRDAVALAADYTALGRFYTAVGAVSHTPVPIDGSVPYSIELHPSTESDLAVSIQPRPATQRGPGTLYIPYLEQVDSHAVAPAGVDSVPVDTDSLTSFATLEPMPIIVGGRLFWELQPALDALESATA
jgi:hypothetical protein